MFFPLTLVGCGDNSIKQSYREEDVASSIEELCKKEYDLDVKVDIVGNTLWAYLPVENMINKENMIDEEIHKKIGNIYLNIQRVILSTPKHIDFFVLAVSDIKAGIDFIMIGYVLDMKKFMVSLISRNDFFSRLIRKAHPNPQAVADIEGNHINKFDIKFSDFLINQMLERIQWHFHSDSRFAINLINASFNEGILKILYDIRMKEGNGGNNIKEEILKIVASTLRKYDFKEFLALELHNLQNNTRSVHTYIELRKIK